MKKTAYTVDERLVVTETNFQSKVKWIIGAIERTVGVSNPRVTWGKSTVNKGMHKKIYGKFTPKAQSWISEVLEEEPTLSKKKVSVVTVEYQEFSLVGTVTFRPDPRRSLGVSFDTGYAFKIKVGRKFYPFSHFSSDYIENSLKKAVPSLNEKAHAQSILKEIKRIRGIEDIEDNEDGTYLVSWRDGRRGGDFDEYRDRYMYDYGYNEDDASDEAYEAYQESMEAQKKQVLEAIQSKGAIIENYDVSLYRSIDITIRIKGAKMSNLRNKLIRLAKAKPELRKHLLPILKEASKSKLREKDDGFQYVGTQTYNIDAVSELWDKGGEFHWVKDLGKYGNLLEAELILQCWPRKKYAEIHITGITHSDESDGNFITHHGQTYYLTLEAKSASELMAKYEELKKKGKLKTTAMPNGYYWQTIENDGNWR